jgi:hypothetical protein
MSVTAKPVYPRLCARCFRVSNELKPLLSGWVGGALRLMYDNREMSESSSRWQRVSVVMAHGKPEYTNDPERDLEAAKARIAYLEREFDKLRAKHQELADLVLKHGP